MRIAIVGSGALGLFYGAKLARAGHDVRFLLRRDYEAIMARGLTVHSVDGDFHLANVQGFRTPAEIGVVELVVVGLKTFANNRFGELIAPLVGQDTLILTLQNGLGNEELLAELFGAERILGGVAYLCSNRGEPGVVHHLSQGRIAIGDFSSRDTRRVEPIAGIFRAAGVDCRAVADLARVRWEKLVWNIPFNGICALTRKPVDALLNHNLTRRLILDLMAEVIAAANAQGLSEAIDTALAEQMVAFSGSLGPYKPSMQIDREEGRPLELAFIFGNPLRLAAAKGVAMPRVEGLYALLELGEKNGESY
jgi:2-dehydropantoate 2-reductase